MPFTFTPLEIPEVVLIEARTFGDQRGLFKETFKATEFEAAGLPGHFVQDNFSKSDRGVVRGLHYQAPPAAQGKLVSVMVGEVFDVAVDIRHGSPTFGMWVGRLLSADNHRLLYVPPGFAHGFGVMSDVACVYYKTTAEYAPETERGIMWNDPDIGIKWANAASHPIVEGLGQPFVEGFWDGFRVRGRRGERMKTVLVTGGCGFIGSHFVRLLLSQPGWRVVNLDLLTYAGRQENLEGIEPSDRYVFEQGDIADPLLVEKIFEREAPDAVVNFAAESHVDRSIMDAAPFIHTNIMGVQVLLQACRKFQVERFLQISTDEVYGDVEGRPPTDESAPFAPGSPYAASKAAAELLCDSYRRTYGIQVVTARSSNNYGPNQFPEKLIPLVVRNALNDRDIPVYGDGLQSRDWLFVEDNCRGLLAVLEKGEPGKAYNIGTGLQRTNLDIVNSICRLVEKHRGLEHGALSHLVRPGTDRPGHDRLYSMTVDRARTELGWTPEVDFEQGLARTVAWYLGSEGWITKVTSDGFDEYYKGVYVDGWGSKAKA